MSELPGWALPPDVDFEVVDATAVDVVWQSPDGTRITQTGRHRYHDPEHPNDILAGLNALPDPPPAPRPIDSVHAFCYGLATGAGFVAVGVAVGHFLQ